MERFKTVLWFVLAVIGLIMVSITFTGQERIEISDLPTFTPAARPSPTPARSPTVTPGTGNPACPTTPGSGAYGYLPGAPLTTTLVTPDMPGDRLVISGTIYTSDCVTPLAGALVEVWQADAGGQYDRSEPLTLRAQLLTDAEGRYEFLTVKPGAYTTDGDRQPSHIHYRVSYRGQEVLATRLLFAGDPYLDVAAVPPALVIPLVPATGPAGPGLRGVFDIYLPMAPPNPTASP